MNRHAPLGSAITGLGLVLVFASCAVASDARLGPIPDGLQLSPRIHQYSVAGSTADELRDEMVRLGPKEGDRPFPGYTKWNVRWQFGYESLADRCALTGVTVFLDLTTTLPRWRRSADAPTALVGKWERFVAGLRTHEDGHGRIAVDAARKVLNLLQSLSADTCEDIYGQSNQAAWDIVTAIDATSHDYDVETQHGSTQGARWPL